MEAFVRELKGEEVLTIAFSAEDTGDATATNLDFFASCT